MLLLLSVRFVLCSVVVRLGRLCLSMVWVLVCFVWKDICVCWLLMMICIWIGFIFVGFRCSWVCCMFCDVSMFM